MTNVDLHRLAEKLFLKYGKASPKDGSQHIYSVSVALLHHMHRDRDAASFEAAAAKMHAFLERGIFAHEWRNVWLYRDLELVEAWKDRQK